VLLQHGLNIALYRYCNNSSTAPLPVFYEFTGTEQRFPEGFELSVYRLVQELLNTFLRHSNATEATVQMRMQADLLSVVVEDNSTGLAERPEQASGMELDSLKHRVQALNGSMELSAKAGSGVKVQLAFGVKGLAVTGKSQSLLNA
jgi:signal transduction histidine kinase